MEIFRRRRLSIQNIGARTYWGKLAQEQCIPWGKVVANRYESWRSLEQSYGKESWPVRVRRPWANLQIKTHRIKELLATRMREHTPIQLGTVNQFADAVYAVIWAASYTDNERPQLGCVAVTIAGSRIQMTAVNGFVFARTSYDLPTQTIDCSFLLSAQELDFVTTLGVDVAHQLDVTFDNVQYARFYQNGNIDYVRGYPNRKDTFPFGYPDIDALLARKILEEHRTEWVTTKVDFSANLTTAENSDSNIVALPCDPSIYCFKPYLDQAVSRLTETFTVQTHGPYELIVLSDSSTQIGIMPCSLKD